ncbi:unnamed protein product [Allacma fusca]|uniref:Ig-like domain-containing protein n=1 Tax=Allacma fusca TaxID=39272 RepID=A0A8J2J726_9HEXA|nr:unnamed protein product [Allacma fusca]
MELFLFYLFVHFTLSWTKNVTLKPKIFITECSSINSPAPPCAVSQQSNGTIILATVDQLYSVTCTAVYPIKWETDIFKTRYQYLTTTRNVQDIFNTSTYNYSITYHFGTVQGSSGTALCRSVQKPELFTNFHIFTQAGNSFIRSGKIAVLNHPPVYPAVVPCPSNYADLMPNLQYRRTEGVS